MSTLVYRIPLHNRKIVDENTKTLIKDGIYMLSGILSIENINKIVELSLRKSDELFQIQLSPNIIIRNIQKFYHFDRVKNNPDVAELIIKNDSIPLLRHFFNKVVKNPSGFCIANLIQDDGSFDNEQIVDLRVFDSNFDDDYNNDEARYFEKEL